tara:strand:+ start:17 stop:577 length:561 start_codon:yes stop_codon:yes gene_type:complete
MAYLRNGNPQPDTGFTVGGVVYPRGWIKANPSSHSTLNITEAPVPKLFNSAFSFGWNSDESAQIWKDLASLKTEWKTQANTEARILLNDTDWRVIKAQEVGESLDSKWTTYRAGIRTTCNNRETEIDAQTSSENLMNLVTVNRTIDDTTKEIKDKDGNSYNPKRYEQKGNPASLYGKHPWPDAPTS